MTRVLMVGSDPAGQGGMATVAALLVRHVPGNVELRYVTTHRDGTATRRVLVWLRGAARAAALLAGGRVDVLHAHVSERGSVVRKGFLVLLAKIRRVPVLLHCHGAEFVAWYRTLPRPARAAVDRLFRAADLVAVLGDAWRTSYVELLGLRPERVVVLENPVALPTRVPDRAGRPGVRVVFLGRYGARKGSAEVLAAIAELAPEIRAGVTLRMAGDGEVAETRARAAELGVPARVDGWLPPAARDAALAEADVFVLPSRDEGLPMALLEAMAWGLVPVVSPVGSIGELVRDHENGLLVAPGDVAGLAAALASLATDPESRTRLAGAARASVAPLAVQHYLARLAKEWAGLSRHPAR